MIWTVGHSTRSAEELLDCLGAHAIELVADVRRFPGSRRLPHFGSDELAASLSARGIAYHWAEALGGRRRTTVSAPDSAWRSASFGAYAAYMEGEEFAEGVFELLVLGGGLRTAVMCSEVLWWRCHRRLISDALVAVGVPVTHIYSPAKSEPHRLVAPAQLRDGALSYFIERHPSATLRETPRSFLPRTQSRGG